MTRFANMDQLRRATAHGDVQIVTDADAYTIVQPRQSQSKGSDDMTLEISTGKLVYQYRISDRDPRRIEWRENKHGARWTDYLYADSPQEAKRRLLRLERGTWEEEDKDK